VVFIRRLVAAAVVAVPTHSSEQHLRRFKQHLVDVLVEQHTRSFLWVIVKKEYVHVISPDLSCETWVFTSWQSEMIAA
jgi:hypothetical protein